MAFRGAGPRKYRFNFINRNNLRLARCFAFLWMKSFSASERARGVAYRRKQQTVVSPLETLRDYSRGRWVDWFEWMIHECQRKWLRAKVERDPVPDCIENNWEEIFETMREHCKLITLSRLLSFSTNIFCYHWNIYAPRELHIISRFWARSSTIPSRLRIFFN